MKSVLEEAPQLKSPFISPNFFQPWGQALSWTLTELRDAPEIDCAATKRKVWDEISNDACNEMKLAVAPAPEWGKVQLLISQMSPKCRKFSQGRWQPIFSSFLHQWQAFFSITAISEIGEECSFVFCQGNPLCWAKSSRGVWHFINCWMFQPLSFKGLHF